MQDVLVIFDIYTACTARVSAGLFDGGAQGHQKLQLSEVSMMEEELDALAPWLKVT